MSHLDKQIKKLDEVKKTKGAKKGKFKLFAILGGCIFTLALGVGMFFLIKGAANKFEIIQDCNVVGEEATTIVSQKGNEVKLEAKDLNGYRFMGWNTGDEDLINSKVYTFTIDDNTPTKFTAVYAKEYSVSVDTEIEHGTVVVDKYIAIKDEIVEITVTPEQYYRQKTLQVTYGTTELDIQDNTFTMPEGNVVVTAEFEKVDFLVTVPTTQTGYTIKNPDRTPFTTTSVKANEDIFFKVELEDAYSQSAVTVKNGNEVLIPDNNGVYTIENVTGNVNITVEGVIRDFVITQDCNVDGEESKTISSQKGKNVTLIAKDINGYRFQGWLAEGNSDFSSNSKTYTFTIDDNTPTKFTAIYAKEYNIAVNTDIENGVVIVDKRIAIKDEIVEIAATPDQYYRLKTLQVMYGTTEIEITNNTFTMPEGNVVVTAEFEKVDFSVTVPTTQTGYTIENVSGTPFTTTSVKANEDISFKVELDTAYSESTVVVKNNGLALTANNQGVYTVANITENVTITVEGVQKNTYTVTLPTERTGYTLKNANNEPLTIENVEYGADLTFKVAVDEGYSASANNLVVECNNTPLEANNGVYTVANVTANIEIAVSGLTLNSYTITFPSQVTVTKNNTALTTGDTVYHYDTITLSPTTEPEDGYRAVYTVTGASTVSGQTDTYKVTGNVTIEYAEEEYIGTKNDYPTLKFASISDDNLTLSVEKAGNNNKPTGDLVIPSKIWNNNKIYTIIRINAKGFQDCTELTSVTIPSTMKEIYSNAFNGCSSLKTVTFNNCTELTLLGNDSFKDCTSLTSIKIPASVTEIGQYKDTDGRGKIFEGCTNLVTLDFEDNAQYASMDIFTNNPQLKNVTIPAGVGTVYTTFQSNTIIQSVEIQEGITSIGNSAFRGCSSLVEMTLPFVGGSIKTSNNTYQYPFGYIFGTTQYTGSTKCTQYYYGSKTTTRTYSYYYVPSKLRSVTITGGNILYGAFYDCSMLTNITLPENLTSIESRAFYCCSNLISITIPNGVTNIGGGAFYGCEMLYEVYNLSDLNIEKGAVDSNGGVTRYAKDVYTDASIESKLEIVNDIVYYKANENSYIALNIIDKTVYTVTLSEKTTSIGELAFYNCSNLSNIVIPNSVTYIATNAFYGCTNLNGQTDGNAVYCGNENNPHFILLKAVNTDITSCTINENCIVINSCAFYGCGSLTEITISSSITNIGSSAFQGCTGLQKVVVSSIEDWLKISFSNETANPLYFAMHLYIGENEISGDIVIPDTITSIPAYAFYECSLITSITIPNTVISIGDCAFNGCTGLIKVVASSIEDWLKISFGSSSDDYNPLYYAKHLYIGENEISGDIVIPNTITSINKYAFYECSLITSITIQSSVTSIEQYAFSGCIGLTKVVISSVEDWLKILFEDGTANPLCYAKHLYIGENEVTELVIPNTVTRINYYAFYGFTSLTSITVQSSVTSIGQYAFSGCTGLTSVTISSSVTSIGKDAFYGCSSLVEMTLPFVGGSIKTSNDTYQYPFGFIFGSSSYDGGTSVRQYYYGPSTSSTTYVTFYIPSSLRTVTITGGNILYGAFYDCSMLTSITLPEDIISIGQYAFSGCTGLTSITLPENLTTIDGSVLSGCTGLTGIEIPNSVTSIGNYAFRNCSGITSITIPSGVTSIEQSAFKDCTGLTCITIAENSQLTSIGQSAFSGCRGLTSITISSSITSIGSSAFQGCYALAEVYNLSSLNIQQGSDSNGYVAYYAKDVYTSLDAETKLIKTEDGVIYYKENENSYIVLTLADKTLTQVTLNPNTTSINQYAFQGCTGLTSVVFVENSKLTSIGQYAFESCTGLTSITIPNSVTSIGVAAFYNCTSLTKVVVSSIEDWLKISFGSANANPLTQSKHLYIGENEVTKLVIPNTVATIKSYAFSACMRLISITIPSSVTSIGDDAFLGCYALAEVYNLSSLNIQQGSDSNGYVAYYAKDVYISLDAETKLVTTEDGVIYYKESENSYIAIGFIDSLFTEITLSEKTTRINNNAFVGCSKLTSVTIPSSVKSIGQYAFSGCTGLTSVIFAENLQLTSIGNSAFTDCSRLTKVVVSSTEDWLKLSFENSSQNPLCYAQHLYIGENEVTELIIPNTVTKINAYAFYNCNSLTSITIPNSVTSIGNYAFSSCTGITNITFEENSQLTSIGINVFSRCTDLIKVTTPSLVDWLKISFGVNDASNPLYYAKHLYIGENEISGDIVIPNTITSINNYAFYECSLITSITIPSSVTSIGNSAFSGCTSLTSIVIPNSVTSIGSQAFDRCISLVEMTLPFVGSSIKTSSDTSSGHLFGCIFGTISYTGLSYTHQFSYGSSTSYNYGSEYYIPSSLRSVTILGGNILYGAFSGCSKLTSITLPEDITSIGSSAFERCTGLTSIEIPNSVTSIGYAAFYGCTGLQKVVVSSIEDWLKISFGNIDSNPLYYAHHLYIGENEVTELVIPNTVTSINNYAFYNFNSLTSITIPNSVTSIGYAAFQSCTSLTSIIIPSSVISIERDAFYGCSKLTSVTFENTNGWYRTDSLSSTSGTSIDVTNSYQNATYLKSTYVSYYWKRNG